MPWLMRWILIVPLHDCSMLDKAFEICPFGLVIWVHALAWVEESLLEVKNVHLTSQCQLVFLEFFQETVPSAAAGLAMLLEVFLEMIRCSLGICEWIQSKQVV
jgi:hypothetical protein